MEVTVVFLLGSMVPFLLKQPRSELDRNHSLNSVIIVPLGQSGPPFRERFGVDVYTLFNMTEISSPLISEANPSKANVCGRKRPGVDLRLVDANDCPVAEENPNYRTFNNTHLISPDSILENDTDVDDDVLSAILETGVQNGVLMLSPDGSLTYSPNPGFDGNDTFTYTANDGFCNSSK